MSTTADVMAIVLFVFFAVGVAVGIVMVIALSARRVDKTDHRPRQRPAPAADPGYFDDEPAEEPPWWQSRDDD